MTRKEREKELRRKTILEAAWKVFARDGYFNATMSHIATVAEFGMGTIYRFFPNKQALFSEVILSGVESFMIGLRKNLEKKETWREKLKAFIEYKLQWVERQTELQRLIMELFHSPVSDVTPHLIEIFKSFRQENNGILKEILSEAKKENKRIDIELISLLITGTLNAIANDWLIGVLGKLPTEFIPGLVGIVTGGIDE